MAKKIAELQTRAAQIASHLAQLRARIKALDEAMHSRNAESRDSSPKPRKI